MSDGIGMFEHADHAEPRREHGYCTDDMARLLVAVVPRARARPVDASSSAGTAFRFLADAQGVDRPHRATAGPRGGRWHGRRGVEDCWGRSVWAFGTAARRAPEDVDAPQRAGRTSTTAPRNVRRDRGRWRSPRSAPPRCSPSIPATPARSRCWPTRSRRSVRRRRDPALAVARAAPVLRQRGAPRGADRRRGRCSTGPPCSTTGSTCCAGCSTARRSTGTSRPRRSAAPGRDDHGPAFDQQPIEVAAIADACARAAIGHRRRRVGRRASTWRSAGSTATTTSATAMWDPVTGGGYDGLTADRPEPQPGRRVDARARHDDAVLGRRPGHGRRLTEPHRPLDGASAVHELTATIASIASAESCHPSTAIVSMPIALTG